MYLFRNYILQIENVHHRIKLNIQTSIRIYNLNINSFALYIILINIWKAFLRLSINKFKSLFNDFHDFQFVKLMSACMENL